MHTSLLGPRRALSANPDLPAADPSFPCMRTAGASWRVANYVQTLWPGRPAKAGVLTGVRSVVTGNEKVTRSESELQKDKETAVLEIWLPIGIACGLAVVVLVWWVLRRRRLKREGRDGMKPDDSRRVVRPLAPVDCDRPPLVMRRVEPEGPGVGEEKKGARGNGSWWMRSLVGKEVGTDEMELEIHMRDGDVVR